MKDEIIHGDALNILKTMPAESGDCIITSPPYYKQRDYNVKHQIGQEKTVDEYVNKLCDIFDEGKRILKSSGSCWVNLGDKYNEKTRSLYLAPERFAIEMIKRGWIIKNQIIWQKRNCMPNSDGRKFTIDYEKVFFFVKTNKYYFKQQLEPASDTSDTDYRQALRKKQSDQYNLKKPYKNNFPKSFRDDGNRNKRCVWDIPTKPYKEAHFATFPEELVETPIDAGCPQDGIVLDPFMGSGTTGLVAKKYQKHYIGIELKKEYIKIAEDKIGLFLF